jgi:CheY-like chemotaxis protein
VLLLDDETALRNALLRFLSRRGIDALGVGDGAEALKKLTQRDFDVIVSDVRMPGMSGREFIAELRQRRPDLVTRLIFSTGDSLAPDTAELIQSTGVPTVSKPFDFIALEQIIRDVAARTINRQVS